jgi:Protein of unknown function (DUF3887)
MHMLRFCFAPFLICALMLSVTGCKTETHTMKNETPTKALPAVESAPSVEKEQPQTPRPEPALKKLNPDEVDSTRVETALGFVEKYMKSCKAEQFEKLGDEVADEMRNNLTPELQQQGMKALSARFGEYQLAEYVEAWRTAEDPDSTVFRFRGTYSKGDKPEIRVVLRKDNKVTGFWIKPWRDSMLPPKSVKIAKDQVDSVRRATAQKLADGFLGRQGAGKFEKLGEEATTQMREALTPQKQKQAWESITARSGNYQSLQYVETWKVAGGELTVYRFRATFTNEKPEVRVVLDRTDKLSGLWIRPWKDEME